ncbi:MAG: hypothetical protein KDC73_05560 [Ignavibacteriae bacterium]|nr:hypothetical protein [Ignavibacteriota bacterium]MCB9243808.1 hypothetical protein [Ignavibacteriales bacterium]
MENSKLVPLLQSLDKEEFKQFGRFVKSKVYNPNKNLIKLYEELKKYYPDFKPRNIEQEKIYLHIFPGKPFHIGIMRNLISDMMQLVKDFFVYSESVKDTLRQKTYLLRMLDEKELQKFFDKELAETNSIYKSEKVFNELNELDMYYVREAEAKNLKRTLPVGKASKYYNTINNRVDNLVNFFVVSVLKEYFNLICGRTIVKFDENLSMKDEVFAFITANREKYFSIPIIDILYHFIQLKERDIDDKMFELVKKKIYDNEKNLLKNDLKNLFLELTNYCVKRELDGEKKYLKVSLEIKKEMLDCGLYYHDDGYLSGHAYSNIAVTAYNAKEFEWAEKFLYDYKDKLRRSERNNSYNYNLALKFYTQGSLTSDPDERKYFYETSLNLLSMVKIEDYFYETRVKLYQIRIYFELDELQRTLFLLDTLKHFLKKNKVMPKDTKERFKSFADHVYHLIKLRSGSDRVSFEEFKESVKNAPMISSRNWLRKQVERLEADRKKGVKPIKPYETANA